MIVPGHVVFLWRIIHQHFTLAFLEHISACRRNKPSWPFGKSCLLWPKIFSLLYTVLFFSGEISATHRRRAFHSFGLFVQRQIQEAFSLQTAYSFREVPGAGRVELFPFFLFMTLAISQVFFCVWLVRFYAVSTTWTSDRRSSHIPPAPPAPAPWSCHGRRRKGSYVSSLAKESHHPRIHAQ